MESARPAARRLNSLRRISAPLFALCLTACAHDVLETGSDGNRCIDPSLISHRQYSQAIFSRTETSAKVSFSVTGYTSHEARLSNSPYLDDPVTEALREYAASHPKAVSSSVGGLKKVDAWIDPTHSTPQQPVLMSAPDQGWFLVEPLALQKDAKGGFFVECPATAHGEECVRHRRMAGMSVEIGITREDLQHWAEADTALRTALFSLLSPCMP